MRDQYMRTGEGFIIVYAIDTQASFEEVTSFHDQVRPRACMCMCARER